MKKVFIIEDLDCAHCAAKIEQAVAKLSGVKAVSVNFLSQKMTIDAADELFDSVVAEAVKIAKKIEPDCNVIL